MHGRTTIKSILRNVNVVSKTIIFGLASEEIDYKISGEYYTCLMRGIIIKYVSLGEGFLTMVL
jgi:hypothetical protein